MGLVETVESLCGGPGSAQRQPVGMRVFGSSNGVLGSWGASCLCCVCV